MNLDQSDLNRTVKIQSTFPEFCINLLTFILAVRIFPPTFHFFFFYIKHHFIAFFLLSCIYLCMCVCLCVILYIHVSLSLLCIVIQRVFYAFQKFNRNSMNQRVR